VFTTDLFGKETIFGLSLNNNPGVQDPFNTMPAWSFPYLGSGMAAHEANRFSRVPLLSRHCRDGPASARLNRARNTRKSARTARRALIATTASPTKNPKESILQIWTASLSRAAAS
jgi:hypothetical protein